MVTSSKRDVVSSRTLVCRWCGCVSSWVTYVFCFVLFFRMLALRVAGAVNTFSNLLSDADRRSVNVPVVPAGRMGGWSLLVWSGLVWQLASYALRLQLLGNAAPSSQGCV